MTFFTVLASLSLLVIAACVVVITRILMKLTGELVQYLEERTSDVSSEENPLVTDLMHGLKSYKQFNRRQKRGER